MGADIWLGQRGQSLGYFRDSYGSGLATLNYLGLYYWTDLGPRLQADGSFPLADNAWLLEELRRRAAERLSTPNAVELATAYLAEHDLRGVPEMLVPLWYDHIQQLIRLLEQSTRIGVPLTMSL